MKIQEFRQKIQNLIQADETSKAIEALKNISEDLKQERILNDVILLGGRLESNERSRRLHIAPVDALDHELNKIRVSILEITDKISATSNIPNELQIEKYFREAKTFPRSYFYQLLTITFFGALMLFFLIERKISDLSRFNLILTSENDRTKKSLYILDSTYNNTRLNKLVVCMDSPNTIDRQDNIYDPRTKREGGTNTDDIAKVLEPLNILVMKELTDKNWNRWVQINKFNADLIIIHYSCFYPSTSLDEAGRFELFLKRVQDCNSKILIYSRQPHFREDSFINNWVASMASLYPKLKGKIFVFKTFPEEDDKVQKKPFTSFRHMVTEGDLEGKVKDILGIR